MYMNNTQNEKRTNSPSKSCEYGTSGVCVCKRIYACTCTMEKNGQLKNLMKLLDCYCHYLLAVTNIHNFLFGLAKFRCDS